MIVKRRKVFGMIGNLREGIDGIVDDISPIPLPTGTRVKKGVKGLGNFLIASDDNDD